MLIRLLLLTVMAFCVADSSSSQTYNGYGKGYDDYATPTKGKDDFKTKRSARYTYPGRQVSSFSYRPHSASRSYGYNRRTAAKPSSSLYMDSEPSLISSYKGNYRSTRPSSYSKSRYSSSPSFYPDYADSYGSSDYSQQASLSGSRASTYETPYDASAPGRSSYFPKSSSSLYFPKLTSSSSYEHNFPGSSYGDVGGSNYGEGSSSRGGSRPRYGAKSFHSKQAVPNDSFKFYGNSDSRYRSKDPCIALKQGDYVLDRRFHSLFSYVDPQCYFVKCANKKAYLNSCSKATRNNQDGEGFCNIIDLEGFCGPSFHAMHEKKNTHH